jgi:hypothetical protein
LARQSSLRSVRSIRSSRSSPKITRRQHKSQQKFQSCMARLDA